MRKSLLTLILAAFVTAIWGARSPRWADQADRRKADYLFLEAQSRGLADESDAALELLERAHALNPGDRAIGYELAGYLLRLLDTDTTLTARTGELLKAYYDENPADLYPAVTYGTYLAYTGRYPESAAVWERLHHQRPDDIEVSYRYYMSLLQLRDTLSSYRAIALIDTIHEAVGGAAPELLTQKFQLLYALGDTTRMRADTRALLDAPGGRTVDNLILASNVYGAMHSYDEASECLYEACDIDTVTGMAYYYLASMRKEMGDSAGYDEAIYEALRRPSLDVEVKEGLLLEFINAHQADTLMDTRIMSLFDQLVDQHPHESLVHESLGRYQAFKGRYRQAAEEMGYALDIDPENPELWKLRTQVLIAGNDYTGARASADRALHYYPTDLWMHLLKAVSASYDLDSDTVIALADHALAVADSADTDPADETRLSILNLKANTLHQMGRTDDAIAVYDSIIALNPADDMALNNLAYFLATEGRDLDRAQLLVEHALLINPDNLHAVDTYAWVMFRKKDYARARQIFDSAIDRLLAPDNGDGASGTAEAYDHAGDIYFMTGEAARAVEYWQKALELDPDNPLIRKKVTHGTIFFE